MKKNNTILVVISSLAVDVVLGYLLMKQLKDTKTKYFRKPKEDMRADFEKYGM